MQIQLIKQRDGSFIPVHDSDYDVAKRIKEGLATTFEVKFNRNLGFHKKFQALVKLAYDNQDTNLSFESFKELLIIRSGHFTIAPTGCGLQMFPVSIDFDSMDQIRFEKVYSSVLDTVLNTLKIENKTLQKELNRFL